MYFIQYGAGRFINAEHVCWIDLSRGGDIVFSLIGNADYTFTVDTKFKTKFLNGLQTLDSNVSNIETSYSELNK